MKSLYESINDSFKRLTENIEERFEMIKTKSVPDSDGFLTDYTLWYDGDEDNYFTIFGDNELYTPEDSSHDMDFGENLEEAEDWFDSYSGLDGDLDEEILNERNESLTESYPYYFTQYSEDNMEDVLENLGRYGGNIPNYTEYGWYDPKTIKYWDIDNADKVFCYEMDNQGIYFDCYPIYGYTLKEADKDGNYGIAVDDILGTEIGIDGVESKDEAREIIKETVKHRLDELKRFADGFAKKNESLKENGSIKKDKKQIDSNKKSATPKDLKNTYKKNSSSDKRETSYYSDWWRYDEHRPHDDDGGGGGRGGSGSVIGESMKDEFGVGYQDEYEYEENPYADASEFVKENDEPVEIEYVEDEHDPSKDFEPSFWWNNKRYYLDEFTRCHNNPFITDVFPQKIHGMESDEYRNPLFIEIVDDEHINIYREGRRRNESLKEAQIPFNRKLYSKIAAKLMRDSEYEPNFDMYEKTEEIMDEFKLSWEEALYYVKRWLGNSRFIGSSTDTWLRLSDEDGLGESLTEANLHPRFKKDIKREYKRIDRQNDEAKRNQSELRDMIRNARKLSDKDFEYSEDEMYDAVTYDNPRYKLKKFKYEFPETLEVYDYPYYVTFYSQYPIYEPAEGGYYYAGTDAESSKGFDSIEEARDYLEQLKDEASTYEGEQPNRSYNIDNKSQKKYFNLPKGLYGYRWDRKYIGDDLYIVIEPRKTYLSHIKGWEPYE